MSSNTDKGFDFTGISRLNECKSYEEANEHLELGWVLISAHLTDFGHPVERHQNTIYCLGWPKLAGEPKYPERSYAHLEF